ncbi:AI-2E family transporter [Vallicoccus soli]|uniref:AI-2E family transporter n=1 Tax=Vallicoccus soli TaxID=2339232 RepID=A0A3A3Z8D7_9ACTN|nr:AI-2E family transporter [Vallicoccus soli]RJK98167.1 AI-2E family transporter [Vallicoccus soli]
MTQDAGGGTGAERERARAEQERRRAEQAAGAAQQHAERAEGAADVSVEAAQVAEVEAAQAAEAAEAATVVDERLETLIDEKRMPEHPEPFGHPGRPLSRNSPFVLGFLAALGVLLAYYLVQVVTDARSVIVLIVVSMFLAIGLNPAVEGLIDLGMRRARAVLVVFAGVIAAFVGFGFAVVPPLVEQTTALVETLPDLVGDLQRSERVRELDEQYGVLDRAQEYLASGNVGEQAFGGILGVGRVLLSTVFSAFTVLILTLYFLASLPAIKRQAYLLVPASRRERVTLLGDEILSRIGSYVGGAATVAFLAGISSLVFLSVIGIDYALPLSLLVGLLGIVPVVGATIAGLVVCAVAFGESVGQGVACVVFYLVYQQVENYVLYPRIMARSVDVPAAATVMAALIGGALLGVVGALLAIPVAAGVLLLVREVWIPRQERL